MVCLLSLKLDPIAVFFNLGSAEPRGSAQIFLGSPKYLTISSFAIFFIVKTKPFQFKLINLPQVKYLKII